MKQVLQFAQRMFNKERDLFMHGWVQGMEVHPEFYWARVPRTGCFAYDPGDDRATHTLCGASLLSLLLHPHAAPLGG